MVTLSPRPMPASEQDRYFLFGIRTSVDPQAMARVGGLFARLGLIPRQLCCRRTETLLVIDVEVELESRGAADMLVEKMRSLVLVEGVAMVEREDP